MKMNKFSLILLLFLGASSAYVLFDKGAAHHGNVVEDLGLEPYIFENLIAGILELLKKLLKEGSPNNGIPPLDPSFLPRIEFDFKLNDTELEGYFANMTIGDFSNFVPEKIQFDLIPLVFKLDVFFNQLSLEGNYKIIGDLLGYIPINGKGRFASKATNVTVSLLVNPVLENTYIQIQHFLVDYKIMGAKLNFTNEFDSGELQTLDERLALQILEEIRVRYMPMIVETLKLLGNDVLRGYSVVDILKIIVGFLNIFKAL